MGTFSETLIPARERHQAGVDAVNAGNYWGIADMLLAYPELAMRAVAGGVGEASGYLGQDKTQQRKLARDIMGMFEVDLPIHAPPATRFAETVQDMTPHAAVFMGVSHKNFPRDALKRARQMEKEGISVDDIFQFEGIFKDFDGQWKAPVPHTIEQKSKLTENAQPYLDVFRSPQLEENFSDVLQSLHVQRDPTSKFRGGYDPVFKLITLGKGAGRETLAHETFHAVEYANPSWAKATGWDTMLHNYRDYLTNKLHGTPIPTSSNFLTLGNSHKTASDNLTNEQISALLSFTESGADAAQFMRSALYRTNLGEINADFAGAMTGKTAQEVRDLGLPYFHAQVPPSIITYPGNYEGFSRQLYHELPAAKEAIKTDEVPDIEDIVSWFGMQHK